MNNAEKEPALKIISRGYGVENVDGKAHKYATLETSDGRHWREALGPELDPAKLFEGTLIYFGRGNPKPASEFADWVFPGGHPFLHGMCMLGIPVYIEQMCPVCGQSPCEGYARGGHRVPACWCGRPLGHDGQEKHE